MRINENSAFVEQAISRIHRMTQSKQTFIHMVMIQDTVEEGLMDNVLKKKVSFLALELCVEYHHCNIRV